MTYTPVLLNFFNTQPTSYLQFFQIFSIHLSLLGPTPQNLKYQKIIPIFKAVDKTDTFNYGAISLLSNFNRVFEKIMYDIMRDFIEKHSLLYSSQYGFR